MSEAYEFLKRVVKARCDAGDLYREPRQDFPDRCYQFDTESYQIGLFRPDNPDSEEVAVVREWLKDGDVTTWRKIMRIGYDGDKFYAMDDPTNSPADASKPEEVAYLIQRIIARRQHSPEISAVLYPK